MILSFVNFSATRKSRWLNDLTKVLNFDHGGWILKHTIMQAMKYAKGSKSVGFDKDIPSVRTDNLLIGLSAD